MEHRAGAPLFLLLIINNKQVRLIALRTQTMNRSRVDLDFHNNTLHSNTHSVTVFYIVTMADTLTKLKQYCSELGGDPEIVPDESARRGLPMFLAQLYDVARATLFGQDLLLFVLKGPETPTPAEMEKQALLLTKQFGKNITFVFPSLPSFDRNRLLKRRIPFIVPQRQLFLPGTMLDLRELHGSSKPPRLSRTLSMPAQAVLLYHIQGSGGDAPLAMGVWASALRYSRMSISRAQRELTMFGLVEPIQRGREIDVRFTGNRQELWKRALPLMRSPVRKSGYYRLPEGAPVALPKAGLSALADYTDLAEGNQRCAAGWWKLLKTRSDLEEQPYRDNDTVTIQSWWYPPDTLAGPGTVDRLSLYLSLCDDADERVEAALTRLLEEVPW